MIRFYDSLKEFELSVPQEAFNNTAREFNGWQTLADARANLWRGNSDAIKRSDKLLDKLELGINTDQRIFERGLVGFMPCVPSYLAGSPMAMYHESHTPSDTSPVRVFASICVSAGLSARQLEARGVAILALVRRLQAVRPVGLFIYADLDGNKEHGGCAIPVVKIETNPLDLTLVSYAMANAGFLRQLCFTWSKPYGYQGRWAYNLQPTETSTQARLRRDLGMTETDLLIPGGYASDPLVRDPVAWITEQLSKYGQTEE